MNLNFFSWIFSIIFIFFFLIISPFLVEHFYPFLHLAPPFPPLKKWRILCVQLMVGCLQVGYALQDPETTINLNLPSLWKIIRISKVCASYKISIIKSEAFLVVACLSMRVSDGQAIYNFRLINSYLKELKGQLSILHYAHL